MNMKLRGLMAAAVIGGASFTGAAALPSGDAQALSPVVVKKDLTKRHVVRINNRARLRQIALQIRRLSFQRRADLAKLRGLRRGLLVATRLNHGNCSVVSTRAFRNRLALAVRSGRLSPVRARYIMRNARVKSARCQTMLRRSVRIKSAQIARLKRLYAALSHRRGRVRG